MLPEPAVFLGHQRINKVFRNIGKGDWTPVFHDVKTSDFLPVAVVNDTTAFELGERGEIIIKGFGLIMFLHGEGAEACGDQGHEAEAKTAFHPPAREERRSTAASAIRGRRGLWLDEISDHGK